MNARQTLSMSDTIAIFLGKALASAVISALVSGAVVWWAVDTGLRGIENSLDNTTATINERITDVKDDFNRNLALANERLSGIDAKTQDLASKADLQALRDDMNSQFADTRALIKDASFRPLNFKVDEPNGMLVVAEKVFRTLPFSQAYGPVRIDTSDQMVTTLLMQSVARPGVSGLFSVEAIRISDAAFGADSDGIVNFLLEEGEIDRLKSDAVSLIAAYDGWKAGEINAGQIPGFKSPFFVHSPQQPPLMNGFLATSNGHMSNVLYDYSFSLEERFSVQAGWGDGTFSAYENSIKGHKLGFSYELEFGRDYVNSNGTEYTNAGGGLADQMIDEPFPLSYPNMTDFQSKRDF